MLDLDTKSITQIYVDRISSSDLNGEFFEDILNSIGPTDFKFSLN